MPWILADDVQTTIRFTITNLDDTSNTLELLVDPWNPYVKYKPGVEIIIGTLRDATFGPMVMVGLGGVTTELFRDVVYRPAPVGVDEASAMLDQLKAVALLRGFRGAAKADVAVLSRLIAQVSLLAARLCDEVSEIELNPVLVHAEGQGVTIVDALVVTRR